MCQTISSSIHFTSAQKKKHPFEMKPVRSKTRNRTSDGFTNLILTGGLTGATSYSSPSLLADQYQESGHYAPFESATCTIDMLLFFICWLYLIPSLLFPLTEQGGSYSRPNLNLFFWGCLGLVLIYMVVEVCAIVRSLCRFIRVLFGVL